MVPSLPPCHSEERGISSLAIGRVPLCRDAFFVSMTRGSACSGVGELGANLLGVVVGDVLAVLRRSMDVLEIAVVPDLGLEPVAQSFRVGQIGEDDLDRFRGGR